jgi:hypothetical protein
MADAYNVYDQQEAGASGAEDRDLQNMIDSYTQRIAALGGVPNIPNDWFQAAGNQFVGDAKNSSNVNTKQILSNAKYAIPGWNNVVGFKGRKAWRGAQSDAAHKQQMIDQLQAEMQTKVAEKQATIRQARTGRQQANLSTMVGGMFDDPSRKALYDRVYKTNLDFGLGQVQDAYKGALTQGVTRAADQGLLGGTVDSQRRADLGATRDKGAAAAAAGAASASGALKARDQQMRQYLMSIIQSGDPTAMAQARAQLAQLDAQRSTVDEGAQANQGQWGYDDYNAQLQSQALGGFAGAGNNALKQSNYGVGSGG